MNKKYKLYLSTLLILAVVFFVLYISAFRLQVGSPVVAAWWAKSTQDYKDYYAETISDKKIIISSGSNGLFGVNSAVVQKITGYPTVNLSNHASLDIHYLFLQIEEHLKKGDILVMPLEYYYYFNNVDVMNDWFVSNMSAWGKESYLDKISTLEYIRLALAIQKHQLWAGLMFMSGDTKIPNREKVISDVLKINQSGPPGYKGFSHKSLNLHGDMLAFKRPTKMVLEELDKGLDYHLYDGELSAHFIDNFRKIQRLAEQRGATLMLTWPATMKNKLFNLEDPEKREEISKFVDRLDSLDIKMYCDPKLFNFPVRYFFDNRYHLNAKGARIRSINLAKCIETEIDVKAL